MIVGRKLSREAYDAPRIVIPQNDQTNYDDIESANSFDK